eukprot:GHVN01068852.1.p1 GENE.GHVN01068852.1~~GHVN01068852.1.p1  ORF type:complete len:896 (-),score=165.44 GHVN01068852.1:3796-6483(-)
MTQSRAEQLAEWREQKKSGQKAPEAKKHTTPSRPLKQPYSARGSNDGASSSRELERPMSARARISGGDQPIRRGSLQHAAASTAASRARQHSAVRHTASNAPSHHTRPVMHRSSSHHEHDGSSTTSSQQSHSATIVNLRASLSAKGNDTSHSTGVDKGGRFQPRQTNAKTGPPSTWSIETNRSRSLSTRDGYERPPDCKYVVVDAANQLPPASASITSSPQTSPSSAARPLGSSSTEDQPLNFHSQPHSVSGSHSARQQHSGANLALPNPSPISSMSWHSPPNRCTATAPHDPFNSPNCDLNERQDVSNPITQRCDSIETNTPVTDGSPDHNLVPVHAPLKSSSGVQTSCQTPLRGNSGTQTLHSISTSQGVQTDEVNVRVVSRCAQTDVVENTTPLPPASSESDTMGSDALDPAEAKLAAITAELRSTLDLLVKGGSEMRESQRSLCEQFSVLQSDLKAVAAAQTMMQNNVTQLASSVSDVFSPPPGASPIDTTMADEAAPTPLLTHVSATGSSNGPRRQHSTPLIPEESHSSALNSSGSGGEPVMSCGMARPSPAERSTARPTQPRGFPEANASMALTESLLFSVSDAGSEAPHGDCSPLGRTTGYCTPGGTGTAPKCTDRGEGGPQVDQSISVDGDLLLTPSSVFNHGKVTGTDQEGMESVEGSVVELTKRVESPIALDAVSRGFPRTSCLKQPGGNKKPGTRNGTGGSGVNEEEEFITDVSNELMDAAIHKVSLSAMSGTRRPLLEKTVIRAILSDKVRVYLKKGQLSAPLAKMADSSADVIVERLAPVTADAHLNQEMCACLILKIIKGIQVEVLPRLARSAKQVDAGGSRIPSATDENKTNSNTLFSEITLSHRAPQPQKQKASEMGAEEECLSPRSPGTPRPILLTNS